MKKILSYFPMVIACLVGMCIFASASTYRQQVLAQATNKPVAQVAHSQDLEEDGSVVLSDDTPAPTPAPVKPAAAPVQEQRTASLMIAAPAKVKIGTLVVIDASASIADNFKWLVSPDAGPNLQIIDGGKKAYLTSGVPATFTLIIAASTNGGTIDLKQVVVEFEPLEPVKKAVEKVVDKVADRVQDTVSPIKSAIRAAIDEVKSDNKDAEREKLAGNFRSVAAMISAGVITTAEDVVTATANLNREALGAAAKVWEPVTEAIRAKLNDMAKSKKLESIKDHEIAWREIADALKE